MEDLHDLQERIQASLVKTTRTVNALANEDLSFLRTAKPSVGKNVDSQSGRLLKISNDLLKATSGKKLRDFDNTDDVDPNWFKIVDVIDSLLEKADTCLDEYTGLIKRKDAPTFEPGPVDKKPKAGYSSLDPRLRRANIPKPQQAFERKFDNFADRPWKPILTSKPHAKVPLEQCLITSEDGEGDQQYDYTLFLPSIIKSIRVIRLGKTAEDESELQDQENKMRRLGAKGSRQAADGVFRYRHPYEKEILEAKYPDATYQIRDPVEYLPVDTTSATWVDTYEGVLEMLEELKKAKEIAVDLEHHDFRTYSGLLSLMQISTRDKDWIVDTLQPWRHKLEILNDVFADPSILKVFHGAYMDIIWLQRDLGLYVVGLFDTFYACEALSYPQKSLASLLKKFVDFDADKRYQLADWRIRPLPEEMLYYARSDTHYLLYVYDMVRNAILKQSDTSNDEMNLMQWVVEKSKEVSLQRYEGVWTDPETGRGPRGWFTVLVKSPGSYDSEQFSVYKAVHEWREDKARRDDESPLFVMSQQTLAEIAKLMPVDQKALWSILNNQSRSLQPHLGELFETIQKAKAAGVNGPRMMDILRSDFSVGSVAKKVLGFQPGRQVHASSKKTEELLPVEDLRAKRSQLWGDVPLSTAWETQASKALSEVEEEEIPFPWAQYVQDAKILDATATAAAEDTEMTASMIPLEDARTKKPAVPSSPEGDNDLEFTIKNKNSRKRRAARQGPESAAGAKGEENETPFDYTTATSVLHGAQPDGKDGKKGQRFNPYASKANDAPKTARNLNHFKPGKTATFKK